MFTLFVMVTGEAGYIALRAAGVDKSMYAVFISFMCITNLMLINLFTGIMCEKVTSTNEMRTREAATKADTATVAKLGEIFEFIDKDGDGTIDVEELGRALTNPMIKAVFEKLNICIGGNPQIVLQFWTMTTATISTSSSS